MIQIRGIHSSILLSFLFFLNACGGGGSGGGGSGDISNNNRAPFITNSLTSVDIKENQIDVLKVSVNDPDGDNISFGLSGLDASRFSINAMGELKFVTSPDYEDPKDKNSDNIYEVTISVSDGSLTSSKNFTIRVIDDPADNTNTEPSCNVYIIEGDIAIQNSEQCEMTRGGLFREFIKYVPESLNQNGEAAPIVFVLHGYTSFNNWIFNYSNFQKQADEYGFILIYPQGSILEETQATHWNVGGWTISSNTDDIDFIDAIIDYLNNYYSVNLNRIYSTGMSNGGFMSYHLACNLSNRVAAIASVTGSMTPETYDQCNPKHPTAVMQIHGAKDSVVPYQGTYGMKPMDDVIDYWVTYNGCDKTPTELVIEDNDSDELGGTLSRYYGCINNVSVELYYFDGLAHEWPRIKDNQRFDIDSASVIWEFFSKYNIDGFID